MLNTSSGQTAFLHRVLVDAENGCVDAAAATVASPEVVWIQTGAHIATVICVIRPNIF